MKETSSDIHEDPMKQDDPIELLNRVGRAEAPEFLLTRIRARIAETAAEEVSKPALAAVAFALLLVLVLNVAVITGKQRSSRNDSNGDYSVFSDNELYHE